MSYGFRVLLKCARYVHMYVTMFGFLLVLFFAVTGFMLNHPDWFGFTEKEERLVTGSLPTGILTEPDKLAVVEALRKTFGARGEMVDFNSFQENDSELIEVQFKSPGRESKAKIDCKSGETTVTHSLYGVLAMLTDLHRGEGSGKHTGEAWSLVIDGVAILLLIVSLTGFILWTSLKSRGKHGLALMGVGLLIAAGVYFLFGPATLP